MKKNILRYKNFLNSLELSDYIFAVFLSLFFFASIVSIVGNIITNFPLSANIKWLGSLLFCCTGLHLLKIGKYVEPFKLLFFIVALFAIIIPAWFYGGGNNIITVLYVLAIIVEGILVFESKGAKQGFALLCVIVCFSLQIIGYLYPELIQPTTEQNVFLDELIQTSIILAVVSISLILSTERFRRQNILLSDLNVKLQYLAATDVLTKVHNRRKILEILEAAFNDENLYLVMLDIDHFKEINDNYDHIMGDRVVCHFADYINSVVKGIGVVGRYGGDEFMIVLNCNSDKEAENIASKLVKLPNFAGISLSASGGLSKNHKQIKLHNLIAKVDHLLIDAKRSGRNQIRLWNGTICKGFPRNDENITKK